MESIKKIVAMKYFKITFSILLNLLIMACFLTLTQVNYEIADNQTFSLFIAEGDYQIIFTNYFLCAFCGIIQNIIYPINAFVVVHLFFCLCAFIAITRVFVDKFNPLIATLFTLFINGFFAINHYSTISFTRAPALLCVAGFLCMIHFVYKQRWKAGVIVGGLFVLIGSTYRFKIFEVALVFAVVFVFAKSLSDYFAKEKNGRKFIDMLKIIFEPKRLVACIVVVVVCFGSNYLSVAINTSTEELSYYKEYTLTRSLIWDYEIPDYEQCKAEYDKINIDENDIEMLRAGYMDDQGAFTLENLKQIHSIQQNYNKETKSPVEIIKQMVVSELGNIKAMGDKGIASLGFILVLLAFVVILKKRNYFIPGLFIVVIFAFYSYLWIFSKCPFRAVYPLWISAVVYLLYSFSYSEMKPKIQKFYEPKRKIILAVVTVVVVLCSIGGVYLSSVSNDTIDLGDSNSKTELLNYFDENSQEQFELSRNTNIFIDNSVFFVTKRDKDCNFISFDCTYYRHPNYTKKVDAFGTDNLYSNLLNNNVYFVDNNKNSHKTIMWEYIEKYYSDENEVECSAVDTVGDNTIYEFSIK